MPIRPMTLDEEPMVREIYGEAHPGWPPQPRLWYYAHPTLVLSAVGILVGFTSFSIGPDELGLVLYGVDLCVLPRYWRQGYGRRLADARLRYGRDVGCTRFLGATQPENKAMRALLERQGFEELPLGVPHIFPAGEDAVLFGGSIPDFPGVR
jgi:RimJ/RimL family protein N-acetyltransferase